MKLTKWHLLGALGIGIAGGGLFGLVFGLVVGAAIGGSSSSGYSSYSGYDSYGSYTDQGYAGQGYSSSGYGNQGYYGNQGGFSTGDGGWHSGHSSGTFDRNDVRNSVISTGGAYGSGEVLTLPN